MRRTTISGDIVTIFETVGGRDSLEGPYQSKMKLSLRGMGAGLLARKV